MPIQSKKLDDFRLKFVDHIDTLVRKSMNKSNSFFLLNFQLQKLNFPYHETQYKMESSIHEETPHQ